MSKLNYLAKVLAALILHSYQNYALCFTYRFPLFHSRPMEWSEEHDVLFLREMVARNVFGTKKGSPARGLAWEAHTVPPNHHKCFSVCNGTLREYVRHLQGEEGLLFQLEIRLCSQLNSCHLDRKHCTIDSQSLDFLNDNSRTMEQILRPKCCCLHS